MNIEKLKRDYQKEASEHFRKLGFSGYCAYSYVEGRLKGRELCLVGNEAYLIMIKHLRNELGKYINADKFLEENEEEFPEGLKLNNDLEKQLEQWQGMYQVAAARSEKQTKIINKLKESNEETIHHIESYEYYEKRYKELYGESAMIGFEKLAEVRSIAKLARKLKKEVEELENA